jgi:hypothetical protein
MAPPRPPAKRRITVLEAVIVVVGFLAIIGYNRLNLVRLQRSLPNVNDKIVGEWKAERGPEQLVFRSDDSVTLTVPAHPAEGNGSAADETSGPPPVTGKYKLTQGGRIYIQLMNGKKYSTTISPINPNRFDLIDSDTDGVTTYDRVNAPAPGAANEAPAPAAAASPPAPPAPSAAEQAPPPAAPAAPATAETPPAPPVSAVEESATAPASPAEEAATPPASAAEAIPAPPSAEAAPKADEAPPAPAPNSSAAQKKKHR